MRRSRNFLNGSVNWPNQLFHIGQTVRLYIILKDCLVHPSKLAASCGGQAVLVQDGQQGAMYQELTGCLSLNKGCPTMLDGNICMMSRGAQ